MTSQTQRQTLSITRHTSNNQCPANVDQVGVKKTATETISKVIK